MKYILPVTIALLFCVPEMYAQNLVTLYEKPGTFEILSRTDYTLPEYGYTKAEIAANLERITELVTVIRKNPVLNDIKGFNGRARIYNVTCKDPGSYGLPSRISFEFSSFFFSKDGRVVFNTIEPPEWSLYINDIIPGWSDSFNNKKGYFTVPLRKKTVDYAIDVYDGECWVIYDPSRPPYWVHVTVNEAFEAVREEIKNEKDEITAGYMKDFVEKEYAEIPVADRNKPAYFGGNASRISSKPGLPGQDSIFPYIMKVNPEYWNRNLSRAEIQFLYFRSVQNKKYVKSLLDECNQYFKESRSSGCDLLRFELSFGMTDIHNLVPLVGN